MSITSSALEQSCRPRRFLHEFGRLYPNAWRAADLLHARRGDDLPNWPDWCYLPVSATQAIVARDAGIAFDQVGQYSIERTTDAACLAALAAWRFTQGIYRFDPAVYDAVLGTPVTGDIPHQILYRLPEWCIYVETPGLAFGEYPMPGFFAHLEHDVQTLASKLRLVFDVDRGDTAKLVPISLPLGAWSLAESIHRMFDALRSKFRNTDLDAVLAGVAEEQLPFLEPIVSLLLYVGSQAGEIGEGPCHPGNPRPKKTKRGWRLFQADKPRTWDVGVRLGAALRRAYQAEQPALLQPATAADGRARPRAHVRRAHWHTILTGPRTGERTAELRWFPPIPVMVENSDALATVVRPVA